MSFEYPKRGINTTTDHPKKGKEAIADDSTSLRFEIENFLVKPFKLESYQDLRLI
jgi:hypothetical protein